MRHRIIYLLTIIAFLYVCFVAQSKGHDEPTSFVDLHLGPEGIEASMTASCTDLAHDLPGVEPAMLLQTEVLALQREALTKLIASRLSLSADGVELRGDIGSMSPVLEKNDVRIEIHYPWQITPGSILVKSRLFPYDSRHRTFLNIYIGETLQRQEIFERKSGAISFEPISHQGILSVIRQFVFEGIHHIFIGPDHILFVVGLLLLGGSVGRLLKIVTAFTLAHSITLGLATFRIVTPPASIIEPIIALSIVFVGGHALLGKRQHDPRLLFAFCFGLIHGFGFANALQEMMLPRQALGWSLFAFNGGVEIGQGCIVLAVAPLLALLRRRSVIGAERVVMVTALIVSAAGAFWFFQRLMA
jgi:hypothetical protein